MDNHTKFLRVAYCVLRISIVEFSLTINKRRFQDHNQGEVVAHKSKRVVAMRIFKKVHEVKKLVFVLNLIHYRRVCLRIFEVVCSYVSK